MLLSMQCVYRVSRLLQQKLEMSEDEKDNCLVNKEPLGIGKRIQIPVG
jgi:hypothetical protein